MNKLAHAVCAIAIATAALSSNPVRAAGQFSNATDVCQASLPSFEGVLRKRPLAIANEGATNSFVSCSMLKQDDGTDLQQIILLMTNRTGVPVETSCTLVDGIAPPFPLAPPVYLPKTVVIGSNNYTITLWDFVDDNGGDPFVVPNLNCLLPPGVEINHVQVISSF